MAYQLGDFVLLKYQPKSFRTRYMVSGTSPFTIRSAAGGRALLAQEKLCEPWTPELNEHVIITACRRMPRITGWRGVVASMTRSEGLEIVLLLQDNTNFTLLPGDEYKLAPASYFDQGASAAEEPQEAKAEEEPKKPSCEWCGEHATAECGTPVGVCRKYETVLASQVAAGGVDTPYTRSQVRRFVDGVKEVGASKQRPISSIEGKRYPNPNESQEPPHGAWMTPGWES